MGTQQTMCNKAKVGLEVDSSPLAQLYSAYHREVSGY